MALSFRFGPVRPFAEVATHDDGRASTLQIGFTTYDVVDEATGEEAYRVSYLEYGGRSDHLVDAIDSLMGVDRTVRTVANAGDDRRYVGTVDRNAKPEKPATKAPATAPTATPAVEPTVMTATV